jgi:hypothetical protein
MVGIVVGRNVGVGEAVGVGVSVGVGVGVGVGVAVAVGVAVKVGVPNTWYRAEIGTLPRNVAATSPRTRVKAPRLSSLSEVFLFWRPVPSLSDIFYLSPIFHNNGP